MDSGTLGVYDTDNRLDESVLGGIMVEKKKAAKKINNNLITTIDDILDDDEVKELVDEVVNNLTETLAIVVIRLSRNGEVGAAIAGAIGPFSALGLIDRGKQLIMRDDG